MKKLNHAILIAIVALIGFTIISVNAQEPDAKIETATTSQEPSEVDIAQSNRQLIVYYFHGNKRCMSCRKIEIFTHEALESNFSELLKSGRIKWEAVNTDNPKHKHFIDDFQLYTKSVVLVDIKADEMIRWKNLEEVWNLTHKKEAFHEYISKEVTAFLQDDN